MRSPRVPNPATPKKLFRNRSSPSLLPLAQPRVLFVGKPKAPLPALSPRDAHLQGGSSSSCSSLAFNVLWKVLLFLIIFLSAVLALQYSPFVEVRSPTLEKPNGPKGPKEPQLHRQRGRLLAQVTQAVQEVLERSDSLQKIVTSASHKTNKEVEGAKFNVDTRPFPDFKEPPIHGTPGMLALSSREPQKTSNARTVDITVSPEASGTSETSGIPGSRFRTMGEASAFRKRLKCTCQDGAWVVDPTPRLFPWTSDEGNYGHCDGRWTWTEGHLSHKAADDVVLRKLPVSEWKVRPNLKHVWRVDEAKCGKGAGVPELDGKGASRVLLQGQPLQLLASNKEGRLPGNERVLLVVGDSMQHSFALSIYDNMRVGLENGGKGEVVPLVPTSLPCHVSKLAHRRMCWGAHFFAKSHPGLKMLFVRNDFLSLRENADWTRDGKNFELPWVVALRQLVQGQYEWEEGGSFVPPKKRKGKESKEAARKLTEATWKSPRGNSLAPVVILNKGMHFTPDEVFFLELNRTMLETRALCPHCLIIFRNTPGGHKGCNDISLPLGQRPVDRDLPFNWTQIEDQSRNPRTRAIVESVGGVFLDVETMTALRGDGHTGRNRQGREDCTHYCAPGPVDHWTKLLFHSLIDLLHGDASASLLGAVQKWV